MSYKIIEKVFLNDLNSIEEAIRNGNSESIKVNSILFFKEAENQQELFKIESEQRAQLILLLRRLGQQDIILKYFSTFQSSDNRKRYSVASHEIAEFGATLALMGFAHEAQ